MSKSTRNHWWPLNFSDRPRGERFNRRRPARRTTPLVVEHLERRSLLAAVPAAGLVSWYRAEGDATDFVSGNGGVLENGATFTAGKVGQAFLFDGVDDQVSIPHNRNQNFGGQMTVEAWVNPSTLEHGRPIAQKRSSGNVGGFTFETTPSSVGDPANGLQFVIWFAGQSGNTTVKTTPNALEVNVWQHVAATFDGTAMRIYVNGIQRGELNGLSGSIRAKSENEPQDEVVIGRNVVIPSFAWKGAIDEVSFYNRAMTQAEIQGVVDAGSEGKQVAIVVNTTADTIDADAGVTSLREAILQSNASVGVLDTINFNIPQFSTEGLVSWYRAEDNSTDAVDSHHGTLQGGMSFAAGEVGRAFSFDGVDGSVDLGPWFNLQSFSVEMWINPAATQVAFANIIDNNHSFGINWVVQQDSTTTNRYVFGGTPAGDVFFNLTANTWQHLAMTRDASGFKQVYINGVLIGSAQDSPLQYDGNQFLRLGRWGGGSRNWNGELDEVRIFDRVLSAAEVQALASGVVHATASGAHTINLTSALPTITDPVIIDGYTQPGAVPNTLADGNDAVILVELDGANAGDEASGLTLTGGSSTIRGLAINRFGGSGIVLQSNDNVVEGNFLGTDVTGTQDLGNDEGVTVIGPEEIEPLYRNDFESGVGEEWSNSETDVTPADGDRFLGQFGSETVTLSFNADSIDQDIEAITVSFDLYVIRTWDGNHTGSGSGPDRFSLSLGNGMSLLDTTFSNGHPNSVSAGQAYPGVFGTGQFDSRTGAAENNTLGFSFPGVDVMDSVYRLSFTFSYTGSDLVLNFTGALTTPGDDESWGLDNLQLIGHTVAASAPNDFSLAGNPNGDWTYGWTSSLGGTLHPYPHSFTAANGIEGWIDNAIQQAGTPAVVYNPTAGPVSSCCTIQPGQINFHPGPNGEQSVVRWTAPADDSVQVAASFVGIDGSPTTTDAHVLHNGASLFDGVVNRLYAGPYFETTLQVRSGDTIDFAIGTGGNGFISDSTALDAIIIMAAIGATAGNVIGGTSPAGQNIVAFSAGDGIRTDGHDIAVAIVGNSIFANAADGIDFDDEIVDPPEILSLASFPDELTFRGSLDAEPSTTYRIEMFGSDGGIESNDDEGQRLLGVRQVTTDPSGHTAFIHELPPVAAGVWITATATVVDGDGETLLATSEFSAAVQTLPVVADPKADLAVTISDSPDPVILGESVTYTVAVTNHGPANATGVIVVALGPVGQPFNSVTIPVGGLSNGASSSFQLVFTPTVLGTFSATATAYATEGDPNLLNNSFTETTLVKSRLTFELAQAQYEVREGDAYAVLTVRKLGDFDSSGSVEFTTINGTAGQRGIGVGFSRIVDFTTTSGELFFRGRQNVATIRVPIGDDGILEPDESFRVILSNPSVGAELGTITSAEVIIHDNDPTLSFFAGSSERNEGLTGRTTIEVRLQPASNQAVTVVYAADGGSATQGTDYTLTGSRTLTFRPGETRKFINFNTVNDTLFEGNETAFIKLSSPINAFLGETTRHRVTIVDNDPQPPPTDPGQSPADAVAIDLATLPRQSYRQYIGKGDVDTFKVTLGHLERLALDVDPFTLSPGLPSLPSSKLIIRNEVGTLLATIGASAEPDTGRITNNAATLFQAGAGGGTYYLQLSTTATGKSYGYSLDFHRIGVSETVPSPEKLNAAGSMYAWFERDNTAGNGANQHTVGITGPTGYGFTLVGPWQQQKTPIGQRGLISQKLTLERGSQFTLSTEKRNTSNLELPLVANNTITISTKPQLWGDVVGVVDTPAISLPVEVSIVPLDQALAEVFGSAFGTVGFLKGEWRISLGGEYFSTFLGLNDSKQKIDQLRAGVPYLRLFGASNFDVQLGPLGFDSSLGPQLVHWIFDPVDPMLMVKIPSPVTSGHAFAAVSGHGLLKFTAQQTPDPLVDAGVTEFGGHIFATAKLPPFKLGTAPLTVEVEVDADVVLNLDANRDGVLLDGHPDPMKVFDILAGDFSSLDDPIVDDIQLGANGQVAVTFPQKAVGSELKVEGQGSVVLNGLEKAVWARGEAGGHLFPGSPVEIAGGSILYEGLIDFDGEFLFTLATSGNSAGFELGYVFTVSSDGISVGVTGSISWSADINYKGASVSGKAKATITAKVAIEIDDDGDVHLSGSISARGRLTAKIGGQNKELFDDSIDSSVRSKGFRFKFPLGVGHLDFDLF